MDPSRNRRQPFELGAQPKQRVSERHGDESRQQAEKSVPHKRRCVAERVSPLHVKDRVGAEDRVLDNGGERRGHDDAGEHGLIKVSDQFLKGEGDGGDGRVECCRDAGRHSHRGQAAAVFGAEPGDAGQRAADAGTDLHGRPLEAKRSAGADLHRAQDEFADRFPNGDVAVAQRISNLDLGNTAACRGRGEICEAKASEQSAQTWGEDGPPDPTVTVSGIGAADEERFQPRDAEVEGHRGQAAESTGKNGDGQKPLPLGGHAAHEPGEKARQRGAVAAMRCATALELDRVLACLGQQARIGGTVDSGAALRQPVENP